MKFCPGQLLQGGAEHEVAELNPHTLIKWPRRGRQMPDGGVLKTYWAIRRELEWLGQLKVPMPKTEICGTSSIEMPDGYFMVPYCMITEKKAGTHFRGADLARPEVRRDFSTIMAAARSLITMRGHTLDLFGYREIHKALRPELPLTQNLLTCEEGLVLVDPSLRVLRTGSSFRRDMDMEVRTLLQNTLGAVLLACHDAV